MIIIYRLKKKNKKKLPIARNTELGVYLASSGLISISPIQYKELILLRISMRLSQSFRRHNCLIGLLQGS